MIKKLSPRLYFFITAPFAVIAAAMRTFSFNADFDESIGYFGNSALAVIGQAAAVIFVIALGIGAALLKKDCLPESFPKKNTVGTVALLFNAAVAFVSAVMILALHFSSKTSSGLVLAAGILGAVAAVYFALLAVLPKENTVTARIGAAGVAIVGFVALFWLIAMIAYTYLDVYVAMNSPVKLSLMFGLLCPLFVILSDIRYLLKRQLPRASAAACAICSVVGFTSSVPLMVRFISAGSVLKYPHNSFYDILPFIIFALSVLSIARLFELCFDKRAEVDSEVVDSNSSDDTSADDDTSKERTETDK